MKRNSCAGGASGPGCFNMMETVLAEQTQAFFHAAALGMLLGILYDVLALFRRMGGKGPVLTTCLDLVFCLAGAGGFFLLVFGESRGIVRGYLILGTVLGGMLYAFLLCPAVRKGLRGVERGFSRLRGRDRSPSKKSKPGAK